MDDAEKEIYDSLFFFLLGFVFIIVFRDVFSHNERSVYCCNCSAVLLDYGLWNYHALPGGK
jgi:hypothetical protein